MAPQTVPDTSLVSALSAESSVFAPVFFLYSATAAVVQMRAAVKGPSSRVMTIQQSMKGPSPRTSFEEMASGHGVEGYLGAAPLSTLRPNGRPSLSPTGRPLGGGPMSPTVRPVVEDGASQGSFSRPGVGPEGQLPHIFSIGSRQLLNNPTSRASGATMPSPGGERGAQMTFAARLGDVLQETLLQGSTRNSPSGEIHIMHYRYIW